MIGADCQLRWQQEADYLRSIQGFLQSGPQLVLQIIIVLRGALIHSFRDTMRTLLEEGLSVQFFQGKKNCIQQVTLKLGEGGLVMSHRQISR